MSRRRRARLCSQDRLHEFLKDKGGDQEQERDLVSERCTTEENNSSKLRRQDNLHCNCLSIPNRVNIEPSSLGRPIGMVCSRGYIKPAADCVRFATYLKAFALIYILPEVDWTEENIDALLEEGEQLHKSSKEHPATDSRLGIYPCDESCIQREFEIQSHRFIVELAPVFRDEKKVCAYTVGHIKEILALFFRTRHYGLLWTPYGYLLIWRRRRVYFVLDVNGRKKTTLRADKNRGVAMLICVKSLKNVAYLITDLSGSCPADAIQLREIMVIRMQTPGGRVFARDSSSRALEYRIVSNNYAYLKARLHLTLNPSDRRRNQSSLMVGVAGIIASKVDHPATWNAFVVDRLICYGVNMSQQCWTACEDGPVNLDAFPTQLRMGQFVVALKLWPNVACGQWRCVKRHTDTDFEETVLGSLDKNKAVLFQINNQMYAMWCKGDFFYLLDPYRHTIVGHAEDVEGAISKCATVRMFRNKDMLLGVFHSVLMESNCTSDFVLHAVAIHEIAQCAPGYMLAARKLCKSRTEGEGDGASDDCDDVEVHSINETICFPHEYEQYVDELSQISDYELESASCSSNPFDENFRLSCSDCKDIFIEREEEGDGCCNCLEGIEESDGNDDNIAVAKPKGDEQIKTTVGASSQTEQTVTQLFPYEQTVNQKARVSRKNVRISEGSIDIATKSTTELYKCDCCKAKLDQLAYARPKQQSRSTRYPGLASEPQNIAVCGSESGTLESLIRLMRSAFKCAERVLTMTPWGNYVIFRVVNCYGKTYYLFDGCTCEIDRFRYLDLNYGTAGLKPFQRQSDVICHIIDSREARALALVRKRLDKTSHKYKTLIARGP